MHRNYIGSLSFVYIRMPFLPFSDSDKHLCTKFCGRESEIISKENLHIQLQDFKCKTSNQLNGFEQIFSDRFSLCGAKIACGKGFSEMQFVMGGVEMQKFENLHQDSSRITHSVNFFVRFSAFVIP